MLAVNIRVFTIPNALSHHHVLTTSMQKLVIKGKRYGEMIWVGDGLKSVRQKGGGITLASLPSEK